MFSEKPYQYNFQFHSSEVTGSNLMFDLITSISKDRTIIIIKGVAVFEGPMYAVGGHDGWSYLNKVERYVSIYLFFYLFIYHLSIYPSIHSSNLPTKMGSSDQTMVSYSLHVHSQRHCGGGRAG